MLRFTDRLQLRDLADEDLEAMVELWTDTTMAHFMGDYGPRTPSAVAAWLSETIGENRATPRRAHNAAIVVRRSDEASFRRVPMVSNNASVVRLV